MASAVDFYSNKLRSPAWPKTKTPQKKSIKTQIWEAVKAALQTIANRFSRAKTSNYHKCCVFFTDQARAGKIVDHLLLNSCVTTIFECRFRCR